MLRDSVYENDLSRGRLTVRSAKGIYCEQPWSRTATSANKMSNGRRQIGGNGIAVYGLTEY